MSSKRKASDESLDIDNEFKIPKIPVITKRKMQGQIDGFKKHSLDSDDEDEEYSEENTSQLNLEGQEEETLRNDGDIAITPFNLKDEESDGTFTSEGDFIWKRAKDEVRDDWLDNVNWKEIKNKEIQEKNEKDSYYEKKEEEDKERSYDEKLILAHILRYLKPNESISMAIRRLGGHKKPVRRWGKTKSSIATSEENENREKMLELTEYTHKILSQSGIMEIYEETFESISFKLKEQKKSKTLDMFENSSEEETVTWEFKWKETNDVEIHGPHTSKEMAEWQKNGFFDKEVFVRKVGGSEFNSSKRIDFELYT